MEWTPSDKMSITDLRAVLASWDIPSTTNDKGVLIDEVALHYRNIMIIRTSRRSAVPSFVGGVPIFPPGAPPFRSARDDKGVGTDTPAIVSSYIGSEEAADDDKLITNSLLRMSISNDAAACAAAPEETKEPGDDARDEPEHEQSAACAGEPDRWVELSNEITAKAKAKGRGKAALKTTKEPKEKALAKSKSGSL